MATVLIVDSDSETREHLSSRLRADGHDVFAAALGRAGSAASNRLQPEVALVSIELPDVGGLEVLRSLRQMSPHTSAVMLTACARVRSAVEAIQLGACEYLEKPLNIEEVRRLVAQLSAAGRRAPILDVPMADAPAYQRWADVVLKVIDSPEDVPTISSWARASAASSGAIRNWCRTAGLSVKCSLKCARMLRVVCRYDGTTRVSNLLKIVDTRTITRFLQLGCPGGQPVRLPISVDDFLHRQQWITDLGALRVLQSRLSARKNARRAVDDETAA
jgi:ActR/RegA family two-component response regulator